MLVREEIERRPPSPANAEIVDRMKHLGVEVLVPLFLRNRLWGMIGCSGKASGRPYTPEDESVLLVFSQRLEMMIENFLLYTELVETKDSQESLLEHLPSIAGSGEG